MTGDLEKKLKDEGFVVKYYYSNCPFVGNIFTACVLLRENKMLSRGVSICSVLDFHCKKTGRSKARNRAVQALYRKENSLEIRPEVKMNYGYIQKCFKMKNEENKKLIDRANDLNFYTFIINTEVYDKLYVHIPYNYPVLATWKSFRFKSEYNPIPTQEEITMFKL
jgi:hypothetical protein